MQTTITITRIIKEDEQPPPERSQLVGQPGSKVGFRIRLRRVALLARDLGVGH